MRNLARVIPVDRIVAFPRPDEEQAVALQIAGDSLTQAGTQFASLLLGCPAVDGEAAPLAELSNSLLTGAALCAGLVELASEYVDDERR